MQHQLGKTGEATSSFPVTQKRFEEILERIVMPENADQKKIRENQSKNYFDATADAWKSRVDVTTFVIEQLKSSLTFNDLEFSHNGLKRTPKEDSKNKKIKDENDYNYTFPGYISDAGSSYSVYMKIWVDIKAKLKDIYLLEEQEQNN